MRLVFASPSKSCFLPAVTELYDLRLSNAFYAPAYSLRSRANNGVKLKSATYLLPPYLRHHL
jgi:hypothetical protein